MSDKNRPPCAKCGCEWSRGPVFRDTDGKERLRYECSGCGHYTYTLCLDARPSDGGPYR